MALYHLKASEFLPGQGGEGGRNPLSNSKRGIFFLKRLLGRVYREMLGN